MLFKIPRLYDSHTHFLATGEFASGLNLHNVKTRQGITELALENPLYYRGGWLVGFGWNDSDWEQKPHKSFLDQHFPTTPVFLAKSDGHQSWLNSSALELLNIDSSDGILKEKDHLSAWERLPEFSSAQRAEHIRTACKVYNKAGFTHIRDLTCTDSLWNSLIELSEKNELTLAIEENYTTHTSQDFTQTLQKAMAAKKFETSLVRMKGIKLFYDGSLGSETALLSQPYGGDPRRGCGVRLWQLEEVEEILRKTWEAQLEFSIHVIGDQSAHEILQLAQRISANGAVGRLNLEHAQVLRPETIRLMKPLHVRCHMQPCHWLSDKVWLQSKLGSLHKFAFPWEALRLAQVPISFGCDSPVEPPSFIRNKEALEKSPDFGIRKFAGDLESSHAHPDANFARGSYTLVEHDQIKEVWFCGKKLALEAR